MTAIARCALPKQFCKTFETSPKQTSYVFAIKTLIRCYIEIHCLPNTNYTQMHLRNVFCTFAHTDILHTLNSAVYKLISMQN